MRLEHLECSNTQASWGSNKAMETMISPYNANALVQPLQHPLPQTREEQAWLCSTSVPLAEVTPEHSASPHINPSRLSMGSAFDTAHALDIGKCPNQT